jgi:uncharacterized damage-inducible protein DinB
MSASETATFDPRYPVGRFWRPDPILPEDRSHAILTLAETPEQLREAVRGLSDDQLDTPYRDGGWKLRQVVHHVADSHMIAFTRFRRGLTEAWPEVHGYDEKGFAALPDTRAPVEWSLEIVESVHARWVMVLQSLTAEQWVRGFRHAERGAMRLDLVALQYAWHGRHHIAHITHLRAQNEW